MLPSLMKLVKVKKTGKRYILREQDNKYVKTYGEVMSDMDHHGLKHGPDKKFRLVDVEIMEFERSLELFVELFRQTVCHMCHGEKWVPGPMMEKLGCDVCNGTGKEP
jgi:DnaJ-class molecular chaperone